MVWVMDEDRELWDRMDSEDSEAYARFCYYRDHGWQRSLTMVAEEFCVNKSAISVQARKNNWKIRAQAYDDYLEAQQRAKNARRLQKAYEIQADYAESLIAKGLEVFLYLDPEYIGGAAAIRGIEVGTKLMEQALGSDRNKHHNESTINIDEIVDFARSQYKQIGPSKQPKKLQVEATDVDIISETND